MKKPDIKKIKPDVILISVLIITGLIIMLFVLIFSGGGRYAEIKSDGKIIKKLSLDTDTEKTIETELGKNTVVVENSSVYMKDADCPDGICKNMGRIDKKGQSIICLPHKLVVVITDDSEENTAENSIDIIVK